MTAKEKLAKINKKGKVVTGLYGIVGVANLICGAFMLHEVGKRRGITKCQKSMSKMWPDLYEKMTNDILEELGND